MLNKLTTVNKGYLLILLFCSLFMTFDGSILAFEKLKGNNQSLLVLSWCYGVVLWGGAIGRQDDRVVRALDFNSVAPGSNPALATSWCCSG